MAVEERRVEVNLEQARRLIHLMLKEGPRRVTADLQGGAGIGKTTIIRDMSEDPKIKVIFVPTAAVITEPGDLAGMPKIVDGRTVYMAPYWAVEANEAALSGEYDQVILLLDDYNRLPAQILQSLMPVFLDYKVGALDLHPKVRVILTSNPAKSEKYATRGLDYAQMERVQTLHVRLDFKVFTNYILTRQWNAEWVAFLKLYPESIGTDGEGISPRTADFANQSLQSLVREHIPFFEEDAMLRLDAVIGPSMRSSFITCLKTQQNIILPDDIISGKVSQEKFLKVAKAPDLMNLTYSRLASRLHELGGSIKKDQAVNIRKFVLAHPNDELTYVFFKTLPKEVALNICDGPTMIEIRKRVYDN